MIEVEKKFSLSPEEEARLIEGAEFISEKIFTDTYFEDQALSLTTNDKWLRLRGDRYELKLPIQKLDSQGQAHTDQYRELETEAEICAYLDIDLEVDMANSLKIAGYLPCASVTTKRRKFKKEGFVIDLDEMDFGYTIGEIEKLVETENEIKGAVESILDFAKENGLKIMQVRGKLIEYFYRNNKKHFEALLEAGVVRE